LEAQDLEGVLKYLHDVLVGGHYVGDTTAHKVMWVGDYWPTLFMDAHAYAYKCYVCQTCVGQDRKSAAPLQPIVVEEPFQQWGLDVIVDTFTHSSKQHIYILTSTNYFTRSAEAFPLEQVNE